VFVICYIYKKSTDIKGVIAGIILGTLAMTVVGAVVNYFITLPFYGQLMGLDAIINLGSVINHRYIAFSAYISSILIQNCIIYILSFLFLNYITFGKHFFRYF